MFNKTRKAAQQGIRFYYTGFPMIKKGEGGPTKNKKGE